MGYGPALRAKPRLQVLRGWDPMSPTTLSKTAAPGATIMSGQLVSKVWDTNKYEFVLGNAAGVVPAFAWSDSADTDVVESGQMTALSCAGSFLLQTGYFDLNDGASPPVEYTYNEGTPLTWSTATPGNVKPAEAGDTVIGYVADIHGAKVLNSWADKVWHDSAVPVDTKVIVFETQFGAIIPTA